MKRTQARAKLWLINNNEEPIIGEGKAALLEAINNEGSLNRACKKVKMSYKLVLIFFTDADCLGNFFGTTHSIKVPQKAYI